MKKRITVIESLIDAQEMPAVIIDKDYRIVAANQAYCASYGVSTDDIVGRRCHEVSHRSAVPCHLNGEDCPHQVVLGQRVPFEVLHTHYDHADTPDRVRIKAYPVETSNGDRFVLETIHRLAPAVSLTDADARMVGQAPAFLRCLETLGLAAKSSVPVLLAGETGVGKELAARYVHKQSARADRTYVELNCAAIPEALFESELFGHERGAFTGCAGLKQGLFEVAHKGTLFLDEVAELPPAMQAKLLRVLDSGEFRRIGGTAVLKVDVRVVTATNRSLMDMVAQGRFREDLYYRIAGIKVRLPPLRERRMDIPALASALIQRFRNDDMVDDYHITQDALDRLMEHDFPGNVRELFNILQQAVALSQAGIITAAHIRVSEHTRDGAARPMSGGVGRSGVGRSLTDAEIHERRSHQNERRRVAAAAPPTTIAEAEARHIDELLRRHDHNRRIVAAALGVTERTLYRKIRRYGLQSPSNA